MKDGFKPIASASALAVNAVAMPVHWYYDRVALACVYGAISGYRSEPLQFCSVLRLKGLGFSFSIGGS